MPGWRRHTASGSFLTGGIPPSASPPDLQLASAFQHTDLVEYLTGSPFIDAITVGGWHRDRDGMLPIPDSPGLGVRLDPDEVAKFTGGQQLF